MNEIEEKLLLVPGQLDLGGKDPGEHRRAEAREAGPGGKVHVPPLHPRAAQQSGRSAGGRGFETQRRGRGPEDEAAGIGKRTCNCQI